MSRGGRLALAALLPAAVLAIGCAPSRSAEPPAADEPVPRAPQGLARKLAEVNGALRSAIGGWTDRRHGEAPEEVQLEAVYHQRIHRLLASRPRLAARTLRQVPAGLRPGARDLTTALRDLFRLAPPPRRRRFKTGRALPAGVLLDYYRAADRRFGVNWRVLAAVNLVESDFNRLRNESSAGAQGPMQFLPSTWRRYGLGGDVRDPHDAVLGAANYLRRSGAPRSYRRALYSYNPSRLYVDSVLRFARRMSGRGFPVLYNWQVFVRTPRGERRLTGPGLD